MSIQFENVHKRFGNQDILKGISFEVKKSEIIFIIGKSGQGKSVTLKCIIGLLKPEQGSVLVDQQNVSEMNEQELFKVRRACGMIFQNPALLDSLTIYENIAFGLRNVTEEFKRARVLECLKLVHLEESILSKKPPEISFGMQKRVSIARTIAPDPQYLLFDEPTTSLDPITTNAINELIFELSRKLKVTSIVVSHDMGCALRIADRILVLDQGKILAYGSVPEIKENKSELICDFLREVV